MMDNSTPQHTEEIVVGLDIGTTKIACFIGQKNEFGKIELLGYGRSESVGVSRGVVANIDRTVASIKQAVQEAEQKVGAQIRLVNVGIAGQHIKSLQHRGLITRENLEAEIGQNDIEALIEDMHKLVMQPGEEILHVIPQEFTVDNEQGIKDPIGMSGVRLEANFHIITGQMAAAQNIYKCIRKAGLEVDQLILEPLASAAPRKKRKRVSPSSTSAAARQISPSSKTASSDTPRSFPSAATSSATTSARAAKS